MGRFLGALALTFGLYACSSGIDATHPIQTTVADLAKGIKSYEGKAVSFEGPAFAVRGGYVLHGFLDADGTDRTTGDRVPVLAATIITESNDIEMEHRMERACRLLSGDSGTPKVSGVVRDGVFEVYAVSVHGQESVFLPPRNVKFNY